MPGGQKSLPRPPQPSADGGGRQFQMGRDGVGGQFRVIKEIKALPVFWLQPVQRLAHSGGQEPAIGVRIGEVGHRC